MPVSIFKVLWWGMEQATNIKHDWKANSKPLIAGVAIVAALLPALQPMLMGCLPRFDAVFHLYRLAQLERAVQHGLWFPRWLPDLGLGFGFPLFNYYAPLSYYPALGLRWLGLSHQAALLGGFMLGHLLLTLGAYGWTRAVFGRKAALGALLAVAYAPYLLLNLHHRGAYAEVWGLACLSLALWATQRWARAADRRSFLLTALSSAALMLSHNVMALLGMPLLAGYALLVATQMRDWRRQAILLFLALGLGIGLSAFFWLPALREQAYVQIYQLKIYDYRDHFLPLGELFSGPIPTIEGEVVPYVPHSVGWILPLLALGGLWPWGSPLTREQRRQQWLLAMVCLALLLMTLSLSLPLWERLPLLDFIQFPWRFLGPASLGLAVLAGVGLSRLPGPKRLWPALLLGCNSIFALAWLFPRCALPQPLLTSPNLIRIEQETGGLGSTTAGDYLPRWVAERPTADMLLPIYEAAAANDYLIPRFDPASLPEGGAILAETAELTSATVTLETPAAFRARWRWYYFPGWQATLDGAQIPVMPDSSYGLLAMDIPAGRHTLAVRFSETPLRRAADAISIMSVVLLGLGVWVLGKQKWATNARNWQDPMPYHLPLLTQLALLGVGLMLCAIKTLYLDRQDTLFHPWDFDGQQMRGVDVPLQVRFGDDLILMGYDLSAAALNAQNPTALTLYWRVAQPTQINYSVGVHLVNEWGILYGQEDHQHPDSYPTSLLQTDEFIRDEYTIAAFAGTPPGVHYQLLVTVYEESSRQHVDVWDTGGQWRGTAYPLVEMQVTRPTPFPAAEDLPQVQRLDADLGASLRLLGTGDLPATVDVGRTLPLTLFWRAQTAPTIDAQARLELVDAAGDIAAQMIFMPGRADYPTTRWMAGEIIRDTQTCLIPAARADGAALNSGAYTLRVALMDMEGRTLGDAAVLGAVSIHAPERIFDTYRQTPLARVGDFAAITEAALTPGLVRPGEAFTLTLTWRAEANPDYSYSVFVHLLDSTGHILAQRDAPPINGARPTTSWLAGELLSDSYTLTIPPATPPGAYTVKVGLYDPDTYARLPVMDSAGNTLGDGLSLPLTSADNE